MSPSVRIVLYDPSVVPLIVSQTNVGRYFQVAIMSAVLYDAVILTAKEAKYFWKIPRKQIDFIFLANRYAGILGAISYLFYTQYGVNNVLCNFSQWASIVANTITLVLTDYILTIRVLALYNQGTKLALFLYTALVLEAISTVGIAVWICAAQNVTVAYLARNVTVCTASSSAPWYWGLIPWVVVLAYGLVLLVLALHKAAEYWRMSAGFKGFRLVKVLIQDQALYFLSTIVCGIVKIMGYRISISNTVLANIFYSLGSPSFLCILSSRMIFNLKEAGERGQNEGTNVRAPSETLSEIQFA